MLDDLREYVRAKQLILFVGSGVSANLGLPSWRDLIDEIATKLEYDPEVFRSHGDHLALAEYYWLQSTSIEPLRHWMDQAWHKDEALVDESVIHQRIVDLGCPLVYTTNYDRWLEIAFRRRGKAIKRVSNVSDFVRIEDGVTQIVKLHGDLEDARSMVLTETSYFERMNFESPLDIKFRADSIGRAILFVGYSLADINIRYMLFKLQKLWTGTEYEVARPKSFIFLARPNPVQEAIFAHRGIHPIVSPTDDHQEGLADFLGALVHD